MKSTIRSVLAPSLALVCIISSTDVFPQAARPGGGATPAKTAQEKLVIRVFGLRYAEAQESVEFLQQVSPNTSVVAHARTNRIVVRGTAKQLEELEEMVQLIDVPEPVKTDASKTTTQVIQLKHASPSSDFMRSILGDSGRSASGAGRIKRNVSVVADGKRNVIVASGPVEDVARFARLVAEVDQEFGARNAAAPRKVRIVWLVSGFVGSTKLKELPEDLMPVGGELSRIGISGTKVAAQVLVNSSTDGSFDLKSYPNLEAPCELEISGSILSSTGDFTKVQISVTAKEKDSTVGVGQTRTGETLCELSTTVAAPTSRPVVLCVSPVSEMTSVFVVQILD